MEIKADLEKKKTDFHAVVSILLVLKKKLVTSDLLRSTKIGKTVSNMTTTT